MTQQPSSTTNDWRDDVLANIRALINQAFPEVTEEIKWQKPSNGMKGIPVWSCNGVICTGETYNQKVKLTFAKGAALPDPANLFNANDTGSTRRAIDITQGFQLNKAAFIDLVQAAAHHNAR